MIVKKIVINKKNNIWHIVYAKPNILAKVVIIKHIVIPIVVGNIIDIKVHFKLPVSFFIVKHVVEHGKWINENIIVQIAVK